MANKTATAEQIQYVKRAKGYLDEAMSCACAAHAGAALWRLAVVSLGSALESLLRVKYGAGPRDLFALIDKFDKDSYWDQMKVHPFSVRSCATCSLDAIRKQRNSVHPDRWMDCTEREFDSASMEVLLIQHIVVHCDGSKLAEFPPNVAFEDVFSDAAQAGK